jgi:hypothetical protein
MGNLQYVCTHASAHHEMGEQNDDAWYRSRLLSRRGQSVKGKGRHRAGGMGAGRVGDVSDIGES